MQYRIIPGDGEPFTVEAASFQEAAQQHHWKFKSRVFGVEAPKKAPRFYLVRGETAFPISARVAALELGMGGGR